MKDVAPRIFRALETPAGRAGYDTIVTAALAAYGSLRIPSEAQALEFGRLVSPLWARIRPETRRAVGAALSHTVRVPGELVDLIIEEPLEISAPFLVSAPTLSPAQIARLQARGDDRLARILEGRRQRGLDAVSRVPLPELDAPPLSPVDLAQAPSQQPGGDAAAFVRDTLRRLAQDHRPKAERIGLRLLACAREAESLAFFDMLQAQLGLTHAERARVEADETGEGLSLVLKELVLGAGEALAILMLVFPKVGLDVKAFEEMAARYRSLEISRRRETPGSLRPTADPAAPTAREASQASARASVPAGATKSASSSATRGGSKS